MINENEYLVTRNDESKTMSEKTIAKFKPSSNDRVSLARWPCLMILSGASIGETIRIIKNLSIIGREPTCDIVIPEDGISRRHAKLEKKGDAFMLTDLESTNGTFQNSEKIASSLLVEGDKIRLGEVLLKYTFQDDADLEHQNHLRDLAIKDPLTGLYNRRHFSESIVKEINFSTRTNQQLTVIMMDIDFFKIINDTFGHIAGDHVLKSISAAIQSQLRIYDTLARYGGEEFALLLRNTSLENGAILAERIRNKIEQLDIHFEGHPLRLTISLGLSTLIRGQTLLPEELIKRADQNLYKAKQTGRNKICIS